MASPISTPNARITVEMKREEISHLLERVKKHCIKQPEDCDILDIFYSDMD